MSKKMYLLCLQAFMLFSMSMGTTIASADTPFIGEMRWFAGNFAPRGWALCDGQLLDITSNTSLFSLLGTTYGGDGRTTFALPDMRGRGMLHEGNGPGLPSHALGQIGGTEAETLNTSQLPSHNHAMKSNNSNGDTVLPHDRVASGVGRLRLFQQAQNLVAMDDSSISTTGGGQAHNNMQPSISLNCIIALEGVFPSRN